MDTNYTVEVEYSHTQIDLDWRAVRASSRREAIERAKREIKGELWGTLADVVIVSATAHERLSPQAKSAYGGTGRVLD